MTANPVKITDTTFRDAHQSLMATRFRIEDMEPIAQRMDAVGFHSLEVWGGATFDVATRFLGEDPWERLRTLKRLAPNTPLQMLLRGQTLVGYRNYADDVVDAFVQRSADAGIDVYRVFDALNDERNLQAAAEAVKRAGKHLQMALCYSVTEEGRMGGLIYTLDYFLARARRFQEMGADSICVKDMAGILSPYDAFELVGGLKSVLNVPVQLHTHYTSGMASMTVLKAIEAGVDMVDACLAPLALRTAQPAVEPLLVSLQGSERDPGLELDRILEMDDYLESVLPKYRSQMETSKAAVIDARVLSHQIPGGMASNLTSQLREADAVDRLAEVLAEIPNTRKELGYPPLVTPISQMVGSQAVSNVLFGRYEMISGPIKDYAYGLYGRPPAPIAPEIVDMALDGYERGQTPYDGRPADLLESELPQATEAVAEFTDDIDDILTYALYPTTGLRFLRIKHGLEPMPDEMKADATPAPVTPPPAARSDAPPKSPAARAFNVHVGGRVYLVDVDPVSGGTAVSPSPAAGGSAMQAALGPAATTAATDNNDVAPNDEVVMAPMPGLLLKYAVEVGQTIQSGDTVVVLEAMKMENSLPSPTAGTVKALPLALGASVGKGEVLAVITP